MKQRAGDPIDVHVGGRIRQARIVARLTQTDLADGLDLTFQQVQKYEKGSNRCGPSRLVRIAQLVGKPVPWFYEGAPGAPVAAPPAAGDPLHELGLTGQGVALARAFLAIDDSELKAAVVAMVQAAAAICADRAPGAANKSAKKAA